ncbi:hypothetical protein LPU83_pLPU83d_0966 (plasmid) [Rhizobium favelukesii]|uniref:Uncharacterized protein n=1 Tax=Rhizobium favelukesii TaxID=348824 RepID=W6S829_9HYPH|nr:hypothetical protein LPU83_pLPU83d_0966 [Rhizobium favelukesii]
MGGEPVYGRSREGDWGDQGAGCKYRHGAGCKYRGNCRGLSVAYRANGGTCRNLGCGSPGGGRKLSELGLTVKSTKRLRLRSEAPSETIQKDSANILTHDSLSGAAVLFYKRLKKEFPMETQTYSVHKNLKEEATGREAVVNGFVLDMLTAEEAEELAGALNRDEEQAFLLVA